MKRFLGGLLAALTLCAPALGQVTPQQAQSAYDAVTAAQASQAAPLATLKAYLAQPPVTAPPVVTPPVVTPPGEGQSTEGQPSTTSPRLAYPAYSIRAGSVVDPKAPFAAVWIDLDKPVRHDMYVRLVVGGDYSDGTKARVDVDVWFKTGEPQQQQVLVPLTGQGVAGKVIKVTAWGVGVSNNPGNASNMYTGPSSAVITFQAGAPAVVPVPFAKRADRVPRRGALVWASAPDWSNFQAKRGGGAGAWADGYEGYDRTNNEPTIYDALGDRANSTPWEIQAGDLIVRNQNLGAPLASKLDGVTRPYAAAILRATWLARRESTLEVWFKQGSGDGNWPAIWNLPTAGWPPEQDALENYVGQLGPGETTYTMHANGGAMIGMKVDLRRLFNDPTLDQSKVYTGTIMETHDDFTTIWKVHPDGRMIEVGCFPTENGGKSMYPILSNTLWRVPTPAMPTGKPAAYENRFRSLKVWQ